MQAVDMLYQAWRQAGLNDNQAKIMMAETGRENSWNLNTIFGGHPERHDKGKTKVRQNIGLISWNGKRRSQLLTRLQSKGLYKNGRVLRNQETLNEMARFAVWEMANRPEYKRTKRLFLDNPNVDYQTAVEVLGRNYIRWRYDDPKYVKGHRNRDDFYKKIGGMIGDDRQNYNINPYQPEFLSDEEVARLFPNHRANKEPEFLSDEEVARLFPNHKIENSYQDNQPNIMTRNQNQLDEALSALRHPEMINQPYSIRPQVKVNQPEFLSDEEVARLFPNHRANL